MNSEQDHEIHLVSRRIAMINGFLPAIYLLSIGIWKMLKLQNFNEGLFDSDNMTENLLIILFYLIIPSITLLSNSFRSLYFKWPCLAPIFGYYCSISVLNIKTVMAIETTLTFIQLLDHFRIAVSDVAVMTSSTWQLAFQYLFLFALQFYIILNFLIFKSFSVFNYRLACKRNEIKLKKRILERTKS